MDRIKICRDGHEARGVNVTKTTSLITLVACLGVLDDEQETDC